MAIRTLDELNLKSTPPDEYFGEMDLSESEIQERIQYTKGSNDAILNAMYLIDSYLDHGTVDSEAVKKQLEDDMASVIAGFVIIDDYLRTYVSDFSQNFVDATLSHLSDEWFLSEDRALYNAENSANDTLNYKKYIQAVKDGYTQKKWIAEKDNKVRESHRDVDGKEIGILEYFIVGESLMRFPKDYELAFDNPRETINCRCSIKYLNKKPVPHNVVENKTLSDTIKLEDEEIFKTLSASALNYNIVDKATGEVFNFVEGTTIQNREIFAGYGTKTPMNEDVKEALSATNKVDPEYWQHGKGFGHVDYYGEDRYAEVHWFQHKDVGKIGFKIKRWME